MEITSCLLQVMSRAARLAQYRNIFLCEQEKYFNQQCENSCTKSEFLVFCEQVHCSAQVIL